MILDPTWQIILPGAQSPVIASSLGISDLTRSRRTQEPDTVTVAVNGRNADAGPLFAYGATVTIMRGDVQWFVGRVTKLPGTGTGSAESQSYTLEGPWWYLDHLTFRQEWTFQSATTA